MFPFNQWSFNPLTYQNVPSDRVDWATLAQQWIKMKETVPSLDQEPTPPPAPQISKPKTSHPESIAEPPPNDIEGGEAPMDMDTKDDDIPESVVTSSSWNQWNNWPNQWGWGWSGNAGTVPSADNASSTSSSVDSKAKWSENVFPTETAKSTSETWTKGNRPRQSQKPVVIEQAPVIDAAKKKQLPAWIREGLNKMEREKQKKIERERAMLERQRRKQEAFREGSPEESPPSTPTNPAYVPDDPPQNAAPIPGIVHPFESTAIVVPDPPYLSSPPRNKEENTSLIRKTKDEIMEESMLKIRKILTEFLLEATENHVLTIAKEELKRSKSSARAIRRSNAVSSLSGNLGLNIYGSGSEDSDSSSSENTQFDRKSDSDEELKLLIDRKKQDFRKIEDEIEIEIEKQEAKEKSIAHQNEEKDDDDDEDSDVDDNTSNTGSASRLQEVPQQMARSKPSSGKEEDDRGTSSNKSKEYSLPNQEPSGSRNDGHRSSSRVNGDRKNSQVELKRSRSSSSSSSSDSKSESSSSESSRSKSSYSSRSSSKSDTSSHRKRSKQSEKADKRSEKSSKSKRYRSRSRSSSRDRRTDSRVSSSRSYKSESYGRRPSPYRRRSRSRHRSKSRGREKYSDSSRRYDSHSRQRRRRSNSGDSVRSRYKRR